MSRLDFFFRSPHSPPLLRTLSLLGLPEANEQELSQRSSPRLPGCEHIRCLKGTVFSPRPSSHAWWKPLAQVSLGPLAPEHFTTDTAGLVSSGLLKVESPSHWFAFLFARLVSMECIYSGNNVCCVLQKAFLVNI